MSNQGFIVTVAYYTTSTKGVLVGFMKEFVQS